MGLNRRPMQGVANIVRFNWHFYLSAVAVCCVLAVGMPTFSLSIQMVLIGVLGVVGFSSVISLVVSFFVYDLSDLYQLNWVEDGNGKTLLTVNAGFDETSDIITAKFPQARLTMCDFYNPERHTEQSIKRARRRYPPLRNTISVRTDKLPFSENAFDDAIVIFSAHEIRNPVERMCFFSELRRVTSGRIFVTEHLRDLNNVLAYTVGVFHFYSRKNWMDTFSAANLRVVREIKTTPFITTFVLEKHGTSA